MDIVSGGPLIVQKGIHEQSRKWLGVKFPESKSTRLSPNMAEEEVVLEEFMLMREKSELCTKGRFCLFSRLERRVSRLVSHRTRRLARHRPIKSAAPAQRVLQLIVIVTVMQWIIS